VGQSRTGQTDEREEREVFLGEYFHSLDEKGRVVMPSSFRDSLKAGCVVTKGQDGQLLIYTPEEFSRRATEVISERGKNKAGRRFARTVFGGADAVGVTAGGRVNLKSDLRHFAGLESNTEVVVLGVLDHIEIWNKGKYVNDREAGDSTYLEEDEED
jgi:MraZ protein